MSSSASSSSRSCTSSSSSSSSATFSSFSSQIFCPALLPSSSSRSPPLLLLCLLFLLLSSFKLCARLLTPSCFPSVSPFIFKIKPNFLHVTPVFPSSVASPSLFPPVALCTLGNHPLPLPIPSPASLTPASFHLFLPPSSLLPPSVSTSPFLRLCPSSSEPPLSPSSPGYSEEENGWGLKPSPSPPNPNSVYLLFRVFQVSPSIK